jgi:hypothetical protein
MEETDKTMGRRDGCKKWAKCGNGGGVDGGDDGDG